MPRPPDATIREWRDEALDVLVSDDPPPFVLDLAARVLALATLLLSDE